MTIAEYILFTAFAGTTLLVYAFCATWLTRLSAARAQATDVFLTGRDRLECERTAARGLQEKCQADPVIRRAFYDHLLAPVPELTVELRERLFSDADRTDRFVDDAIRHLDDFALVKLVETYHGHRKSYWPRQTMSGSAGRGASSRRAAWIALLGLGVLIVMLLFPPWLAQRQRRTRIIGLGESVDVLESSSLGHRWLLAGQVPQPVISYRPSDELRRLVRDEIRWTIDYGRISLLSAVIVICCAAVAWLVREESVRIARDVGELR